jgi:cellulose synthase (UDP-forming)
VHRREALYENALVQLSRDALFMRRTDLKLQTFRYHVSEDLLTSIQLHQRGWVSVYHPEVLAKMLSPWSVEAWASQKLKYAGGTFDIMLRANPLFEKGMPFPVRLHYLATFWSYLSVLWLPFLAVAPAFSLLTGASPVAAYSGQFFMHLLPALIFTELAMLSACRGHSIHAGRVLALGTAGLQLRALGQVLLGHRPHFPPTPKTPGTQRGFRFLRFNLIVLAFMAVAASVGLAKMMAGSPDHTPVFVTINLLWLSWSAYAFARVCLPAVFPPKPPTTVPV